MNYYRKTVNNVVDNVKLKMQIGALTLKLSESEGNISSNLTKIDNNETNISSNLTKIDNNETNISSNLTKINNNETNISSNLTKIGNNETNISSNLTKISNNEINISSNYTKIGNNEINISSNLTKMGNNETNISSNLTKIDNNETNISSNLTKINAIEENNLKISNEVFNDKYDIVNQSFNFNKNTHSYQLFEKVIENNMTTGELIINTIINYKFDNLENDINRLTHLYEFFDDKNVLFYSITLDNHDFGVISNSDLNIDDNFCFNINNKNNIKLVLSLTRINEWGTGSIGLEMIDNNYINIIYNKKTDISYKFDENDKKIKFLDEKVSANNNLISINYTSILPLKSAYTIDNIWLFNLNLNKDINFLSNIKKILVYENNIDYQFKVNSFIEINESLVYKYDNIKLSYYILKETYIILDQNDIISDEFSFNIKSKGFIFNNLHIFDNKYFFKVQSNITTLKLKVYLERINYNNEVEFNLQLNSDHQNNFIALKYFKYIS